MSEPNYTIVTVCTHRPTADYFCLNEYFKSLQGAPILILDREYTNYSGLASKPKGLMKAIKNGHINTKTILFTDCFDFVFTKHPDLLINHYRALDCPIIISAERNCFPADLKEEYDKLKNPTGFTTSFKYLNSGMIVGDTEAILTCLEAMDLPNVPDDHFDADKGCMVHPNDQFLWQQIFLKQSAEIRLDYATSLCMPLHSVGVDELEFNGNGVMNRETLIYPLSLHLNGNAKTGGLREPVLKHLNLL